jgi:hypothetical protein
MNEILSILAEDCAGVIQACAKLQRYGGDTTPLEKEIGNILAMIAILGYHDHIDEDNVIDGIPSKLKKLKKSSDINDLNSIIKNL